MCIVISWSVPHAGMDPEYTKAVVDSISNGKPMDTFEGAWFSNVSSFPQEGGGCQIGLGPEHVACLSIHRLLDQSVRQHR